MIRLSSIKDQRQLNLVIDIYIYIFFFEKTYDDQTSLCNYYMLDNAQLLEDEKYYIHHNTLRYIYQLMY